MRDVRIRFILLQLMIYVIPMIAHAQWTAEDSVRLQESLSGKEQIQLNPEFRKAIEEGTFLGPEQPVPGMLSAPGQLPLAMDFSEYIQPDTLRKWINYDSITPAVFMLLNLKSPARSLAVQKQAHTIMIPPDRNRKKFKIGKVSMDFRLEATDIYSDVVKDGQHRGGFMATITIYFDAGDLLETIFWKSARDKKRNRKRENTWKFYNDYP